MASVTVTDSALVVRFSAVEVPFVLRRRATVPLESVREATVLANPLSATKGFRVGTVVAGLVKIGMWGLGTGVRQIVSVRRGVAGLRIIVDRRASGLRFDEVLVSTPDARSLAEEIRRARRTAR